LDIDLEWAGRTPVVGIRAFPFSSLFAPTALTKGIFLLFLQEKPAKTAKISRKWPAKQARMQGKERMGKP